MKLIATKDFANSPALKLDLKDAFLKDADGNPAKGHIHKGAQFNLGTQDKWEAIPAADPNKLLIAQLFVTGSAAVADEDTVARVKKEVAADKARADRDNKAAGVPLTLDSLVIALKALQAAPAK